MYHHSWLGYRIRFHLSSHAREEVFQQGDVEVGLISCNSSISIDADHLFQKMAHLLIQFRDAQFLPVQERHSILVEGRLHQQLCFLVQFGFIRTPVGKMDDEHGEPLNSV